VCLHPDKLSIVQVDLPDGDRYVAGSRVPLYIIVFEYRNGSSVESIRQSFSYTFACRRKPEPHILATTVRIEPELDLNQRWIFCRPDADINEILTSPLLPDPKAI
jgi:hypothetical protein